MTKETQIIQLEKELVLEEKQKKVLQEWLIRNFDSPERLKIMSDLNAQSVKIATINYKLDNLKKNAPLLGYEIMEINTDKLTKK